jgi:hypothetical protein
MVGLEPDEVARKVDGEAARWNDPGRGQLELASIQFPPLTVIIPTSKYDRGSLADSTTTHRQPNVSAIKTFYDTCCLNCRSRVGGSETSFLAIGAVGAVWYGPGFALKKTVHQVWAHGGRNFSIAASSVGVAAARVSCL